VRLKELKATGEKRAGVDSHDKIFFPALSSFFFGFFGLLGLSLYSGCYLLKDAEIFRALGITVRAPLSMLGFFGFSFFSAVCLFSSSCSTRRSLLSKGLCWVSFVFSLIAFIFQFYYLFTWGFFWFGKAFFGNQPFANSRWFEYLGLLIFVITLMSALVTGSSAFRKHRISIRQKTVNSDSSEE